MTDDQIDELITKICRQAKKQPNSSLLDKYAAALREKHGTERWRKSVERVEQEGV